MIKSIIKLLILLSPKVAKPLSKINGYKTITGGSITLLGIISLFFQDTISYAFEIFYLGVPIFVTGLVHKIIKRKKLKEKSNGSYKGN